MAQPGELDRSFGAFGVAVTTEASTQYQRILPLSNGKFLVISSAFAINTESTESITYSEFRRINADGTLDLTYGTNGIRIFTSSDIDHNFFTGFARLSDGSIVAIETYGYTGAYNPLNTVWKFNADGTGGTIIAELSVDGFGGANLNGITVDDANRIVVTGSVKRTGAGHQTYIARLLSDGSLDESFNNVGFRVIVEDLSKSYSGQEVTTDRSNNIIVVEDGYYNFGLGFVNGHYMFKFLEDGSARTFTKIKLDGHIKSLGTDNNSKIIALTSTTIKRYNTNGTLDKLISSTSHNATRAIVQPDGKIVEIRRLALNGHNVFNVIRYGTDGNLDPAFGSSGSVTTDLNLESLPHDVIYRNKRLYVSGHIQVTDAIGRGIPYGTIAAYDATNVRMTCPTPQNPYNVDAGKCYATVNGIGPAYLSSSGTLSPNPIISDGFTSVQYKKEYNGTVVEGTGSLSGAAFGLGTTHITYTYTDITTQTCSFDITVEDKDPPLAKCKNVTVQLDASGNGTLTASEVNDGSTDGCGIELMNLSKTSFSCSDPSSNQVTLTVTDINGNSSTCTATVTVEDNIPPVAICKNLTVYLDATGNASITAAQINDGSTDACGIKSLSLDKTTFDCTNKGNNTVTLTVTDNNDNTATCTATVTVVDDLPPVITAVVPTPQAIWPSDRKMKNVTVATSFTDNCPGTTCRISGVAIKAGEFANDNIGPDWEITGDNTVNLRAEIPKKGIKRIYTVTVRCTDAAGNSSTSSTDVIVAHNITSPISGATVKIGSTVNLAGEFWDVPGKKHTARWVIDDKTINGNVTEPSGMNSGAVTGSYKFTTAGVYKIQMNVTDQNGITSYSNTSENLEAIVVVYDPNGGYTYGGGSFWSAPGKLKNNLSAAGDVSYGFTVNYYKGASLPKGETQFNFKLGDFEYNALTFDYLSISGAKAQFKGTGKIIGGQSGINFIMTVIDGQLDGTGADKVRIKIYNKNTGYIYYDSQPGASDAADPVTTVGMNSTIVISNNLITRTQTTSEEGNNLEVAISPDPVNILNIKRSRGFEATAFPNPARNIFNVQVRSSDSKEKIMLQVYDVHGRLLEVRNNIQPGSMIQIGEMYRPGVYYLRIQQAGQHKELRLIKM